MRWLRAWWQQFFGRRRAHLWESDPKILRERERQHELGVTDAFTVYEAERRFWAKKHRLELERQRRG